MKKKRLLLYLIPAFFFSFFSFGKSEAAFVDDFDTYFEGETLQDESDWTGNAGTISDTQAQSNPNSVIVSGTWGNFVSPTFATSTLGTISFYAYLPNSDGEAEFNGFIFYLDDGQEIGICSGGDGTWKVEEPGCAGGSDVILEGIPEEEWVKFVIQYDIGLDSFRIGTSYNIFSEWETVNHTEWTQVDSFSFARNGGTLTYYVDSFAQVGTFEDDGVLIVDTRTRIIDFNPAEGAILTGPEIDFDLDVYINENDVSNNSRILIELFNIDQNQFLFSLDDKSIVLVNEMATTSGYYTYATSTNLSDGNYRVRASLTRAYFGILKNPFSDINDTQNHQFVVGTSTFIGNIQQNLFTDIGTIIGNTSATSTSALAGSCNPLSGQFGIINCLTFLMVPDSGQLQESFISFKENIGTHFPLGYITDFMVIMSSTTTRPLVVIDATIPSVLPGGGANVHLDLTNGLDYILNATTSIYSNESASSTQTLYEITSPYWDKFLYIMAFLYILARVTGINPFKRHETL